MFSGENFSSSAIEGMKKWTRTDCNTETGLFKVQTSRSGDDLTFGEDNKGTVNSVKMIDCVIRTFIIREARSVMTLFKALALSRLKDCRVLTSHEAGIIAELQNIQRSSTACVDSVKHLSYW